MDTEVIQSILLKNPLLQRQKEKLEAMQPGRYCHHNTFGFGVICGFDHANGRLVVDFADRPQHGFDPAFAIKHLQLLAEDHLVAQYRQDPERVMQLLKRDPAAIAQLILIHAPDQRATLNDIQRILSSILGEKSAKAWWNKTRKVIESDPRIALPETKTGYYILRETPVTPVDEAIDNFLNAKRLIQKMACVQKLLAEKDLSQFAEKLSIVEDELEKFMASSELSDSERLQLFWLMEDLAKSTGRQLPENYNLEGIFKNINDLTQVADTLSVSLLVRFFAVLKALFSENFQHKSLHLIHSGNARTIRVAVDFLLQNGFAEELPRTFHQWLNDNSLRSTLLEWMIQNRHHRKYEEILRGLVSPALFVAVLGSIDQEALRRSTNRKISLAESLISDQDFVREVIEDQSFGMARDLAKMLLSNQGFDLLTKRSLLARFIRFFPSLEKLLDGGTSSKQSNWLNVSQESLDRVRREYEQLVSEKIPANKQAIAIAREHGDLKENSEYKMARQDQDMLLARKSQIERDLERVQVIDFSKTSVEKVGIGCVVTLNNEKGKTRCFAILGAWDSDPQRHILAYQTPLVQSMLGKSVGEIISTNTREKLTIVSIEPWTDRQKSW